MKVSIPFTIVLTCSLLLFTAFFAGSCSGPANTNTNALVTFTPTPTPVPTPIDCNASPTDQELVDRVYAMLAYKNPEYVNQEWQFNITAKALDKQVTITGWSNMRGQIIPDAESVLKNCKPINVDNFVSDRSALNPDRRVGCPSGYVPCGDICVQIGEPCKITAELHAAPGSAPTCVRPTPTPTPGPKRK